jgi:periplasmic divalent cation tolerance protein
MFSIVYITAANLEESRKIGKTLVDERLAACVNFFPIQSIFRWKEKIDEANEFGMIVKTKSTKIKEIEQRVKELHSYEIPCVVSFRMDEGSDDYFKWIEESVED